MHPPPPPPPWPKRRVGDQGTFDETQHVPGPAHADGESKDFKDQSLSVNRGLTSSKRRRVTNSTNKSIQDGIGNERTRLNKMGETMSAEGGPASSHSTNAGGDPVSSGPMSNWPGKNNEDHGARRRSLSVSHGARNQDGGDQDDLTQDQREQEEHSQLEEDHEQEHYENYGQQGRGLRRPQQGRNQHGPFETSSNALAMQQSLQGYNNDHGYANPRSRHGLHDPHGPGPNSYGAPPPHGSSHGIRKYNRPRGQHAPLNYSGPHGSHGPPPSSIHGAHSRGGHGLPNFGGSSSFEERGGGHHLDYNSAADYEASAPASYKPPPVMGKISDLPIGDPGGTLRKGDLVHLERTCRRGQVLAGLLADWATHGWDPNDLSPLPCSWDVTKDIGKKARDSLWLVRRPSEATAEALVSRRCCLCGDSWGGGVNPIWGIFAHEQCIRPETLNVCFLENTSESGGAMVDGFDDWGLAAPSRQAAIPPRILMRLAKRELRRQDWAHLPRATFQGNRGRRRPYSYEIIWLQKSPLVPDHCTLEGLLEAMDRRDRALQMGNLSPATIHAAYESETAGAVAANEEGRQRRKGVLDGLAARDRRLARDKRWKSLAGWCLKVLQPANPNGVLPNVLLEMLPLDVRDIVRHEPCSLRGLDAAATLVGVHAMATPWGNVADWWGPTDVNGQHPASEEPGPMLGDFLSATLDKPKREVALSTAKRRLALLHSAIRLIIQDPGLTAFASSQCDTSPFCPGLVSRLVANVARNGYVTEVAHGAQMVFDAVTQSLEWHEQRDRDEASDV